MVLTVFQVDVFKKYLRGCPITYNESYKPKNSIQISILSV